MLGKVSPSSLEEGEPVGDDVAFGTQYALVRGLLDAAYPQVSFVVELPFPLLVPMGDMLRTVVPMPSMRTGESEDTVVRIEVAQVPEPGRLSTAPLRYLESPGRAGPRYGRVPAVPEKLARSVRPVTVVRLTTPNVLPDATQDAGTTEVAVHLFNRCMAGLNRFLGAYIVATEEPAVRAVTSEALGYFAAVELAGEDCEPLAYGGILTLPKASTPDRFQTHLSDDDVLVRLQVSMAHEGVNHPMDTVVTWQARALHYSRLAGDYEMSLLALNISAEVLLDALWATHRVDEGADSSLYDGQPRFTATLKAVSKDLGESWQQGSDDVWSRYVSDCYQLRNETTHEGLKVAAEELGRV